MKEIGYRIFLALLALCFSACSAPKSHVEPSPLEVRQGVSVAFGLPPEASLSAVLDKIRNDVRPGSTPTQVNAYLDNVKKRSPVKVSVNRSKRGQPIIKDVMTQEMIVADFVDNAGVFDVNILFTFDEDDRLVKVGYTQGMWEKSEPHKPTKAR